MALPALSTTPASSRFSLLIDSCFLADESVCASLAHFSPSLFVLPGPRLSRLGFPHQACFRRKTPHAENRRFQAYHEQLSVAEITMSVFEPASMRLGAAVEPSWVGHRRRGSGDHRNGAVSVPDFKFLEAVLHGRTCRNPKDSTRAIRPWLRIHNRL